MNRFLLTIALIVLCGCSTISVKPDGAVRATAIGQAIAQHCPEATPEKREPDCTIAEGGSLSDGFVTAVGGFFSLLEKAVMAIPRFFAGGAAAVATSPTTVSASTTP